MFESQMSFAMASGYSHPRPTLTRSRSHTDPTRSDISPEQARSLATADAKPSSTRPHHLRSRSYLAPGDTKSHSRTALLAAPATAALEKTADKLPRLHLPGSSHRHHYHSQSHSHSGEKNSSNKNTNYRRHRPTQSEAHPRHHDSKHDKDKPTGLNLPHLVAGLNAERERRTQQAGLSNNNYTSNNLSSSPPLTSKYGDLQRNFGPSDSNYADYISGGRYDLRRRATSDPDRPLVPKTSFELLLARGEQTRFARRLHIKKDEIVRRDDELAAAEEEMRSRVNEITTTGVEMTRRLDYGYYNLLEKVNNLIGTIGSFQSLSKQTGQLVHNFEKETHRLDIDTRHRADVFKQAFEARDEKATTLSERGKEVSRRAEDLSQRLENARTILQNWEQREASTRRSWDRVKSVCGYSVMCVVLLLISLIVVKEGWLYKDPVKAGLGIHSDNGHRNQSLRLGMGLGLGASGNDLDSAAENERMLRANDNIPQDIKNLLLDIAERNRERKPVFPTVPHELSGSGILLSSSSSSSSSSRSGGEATRAATQKEGNERGHGNLSPLTAQQHDREDPRLNKFDEL